MLDRESTPVHELRTWPEYFQAVWDGRKAFELRRDDRPGGFQVRDLLHLREYDPDLEDQEPGERYTGRELTARVTYVLRGGAFGLEAGYAVLGLQLMQRANSGRLPAAHA